MKILRVFLLSLAFFAAALAAAAGTDQSLGPDALLVNKAEICVWRKVGRIIAEMPRPAAIPTDLPAVPERIELPKRKESFAVLFDDAKNRVMKNFDLPRIERDLDRLRSGQGAAISAEEAGYLRDMRKLTNALLSSFKFFSQQHGFSPQYKLFVKKFGKLGDFLMKYSPAEGPKDGLRKAATDLDQLLRQQNGDVFSYGFSPSDAESFRGFLYAESDQIERYLRADALSVDDFHDLRKMMRDFKFFFELRASAKGQLHENDPNNSALDKNLKWIATQMGDFKDELYEVEQDAKKQKKQEKKGRLDPGTIIPEIEHVQIDPAVRARIEELIQSLRRSLSTYP